MNGERGIVSAAGKAIAHQVFRPSLLFSFLSSTELSESRQTSAPPSDHPLIPSLIPASPFPTPAFKSPSAMPSLPYWLSPGDDRPPEEIDDEVAEELRLHLDLLAEERMRQGVTPDLAKQQAAERFGDFNTLLRRCRLEKQGDLPMLKRIQAVLIGVLLLLVGLLCWRDYVTGFAITEYQNQTTQFLLTIQSDLVELQKDSQSNSEAAFRSSASDSSPAFSVPALVIRAVGNEGQLIENAQVAVYGKAADQITSYGVNADRMGVCRIEPAIANFEVSRVAVTAPGHCVVSNSIAQLMATDSNPKLLFVPQAEPLTLKFESVSVDGEATPLTNVRISFERRQDEMQQYHTLGGLVHYKDNLTTDELGIVHVDWWRSGDRAGVKWRHGKAGGKLFFDVPSESSAIVSVAVPTGTLESGGYDYNLTGRVVAPTDLDEIVESKVSDGSSESTSR